MTEIWSGQEVNTQIDKHPNPQAARPNFHREIIYI